jgi:hypothetical protein
MSPAPDPAVQPHPVAPQTADEIVIQSRSLAAVEVAARSATVWPGGVSGKLIA